MTTKLMTIKELAERLGISRSSAYQIVEKKLLPVIRVGTGRGVIRITEEDFQAYLNQSRIEVQSEPMRSVPKTPPSRLRHLRLD